MKTFQVHRFGDCVALYLTGMETMYLCPSDARRIAKELNACARDIAAFSYLNCQHRVVEHALLDTGYNGCDFKIERKSK